MQRFKLPAMSSELKPLVIKRKSVLINTLDMQITDLSIEAIVLIGELLGKGQYRARSADRFR